MVPLLSVMKVVTESIAIIVGGQPGVNGNHSIDPLHAQDESATSTDLQLMVATQMIQIVPIHTTQINEVKTDSTSKLAAIHTMENFHLHRKNNAVAAIATATPITNKSRRHRPVGDHHLREAILLVPEVQTVVAGLEILPLPPHTPFRDRIETEETSDPYLRVIFMLPILPRLLADTIRNPTDT